MKSNLFQAYTNPEYETVEFETDMKYHFMYGQECFYDESEDTQILIVDDFKREEIDEEEE